MAKEGGNASSEEITKRNDNLARDGSEVPKSSENQEESVTTDNAEPATSKSHDQSVLASPHNLGNPSRPPHSPQSIDTSELPDASLLPELIQASSTPIHDHHTKQAPELRNSDIDDELDANDNEITPLLGNVSSNYADLESWGGTDDGQPFHNRRGRSRAWYMNLFNKGLWLSLVLTFLVLLVVYVVYVLRQNEDMVSSAIQHQVDSVSVMDVTELGISVHVVGSVLVNYDTVPNFVVRNLLKLGGLALGGVTIVPKHPYKVYVSGQNSTTTLFGRTHVLDVLPPEFSLDLINKRVSGLDFICEAEINQTETLKVAQKLIQHNTLQSLLLNVAVVTQLVIRAKWFHYTTDPIALGRLVVVEPSDMTIPLQIDDLEVSMGKDSVSLELTASALKVLPLKFTLQSIEWDVALYDCKGHPQILGEWITDATEFVPDERARFSVHGNVDRIPEELLEVCSDGLSPFNKFTNKLMGENILSVLIRARDCKSNEENLPLWLFKILSSRWYPLDAPVPISDADFEHLITSYSVDDLSLTIPNLKSKLAIEVGANASVDVQLPFRATNLQASISEVMATLDILDESSELLALDLQGQNNVSFLNTNQSLTGTVSVNANAVDLEVSNPQQVGKMLNGLLNNVLFALSQWDLDLRLAILNLPIVSTTLRNLKLRHRLQETHLLGSLQTSSDTNLIEKLLQLMDLRINQLIYMDSNVSSIEFLVDMKMSNPLNVLLSIPEDTISLDYRYNHTTIGTVLVDNVLIPAGAEDYDFSVGVVLSCQTNHQRILAEELVSKIISAANVTSMGFRGSALSSKKNPALGQLLGQLGLDGIRFPQLKFDRGDDDESDAAILEPRSPFLIDATIHVLTSEIELTVFNPAANVELVADIIKCQATYKGETLANIDRSDLMIIPPGIYKTPRIPVKIAQGIGADILRRAMNGNLFVEVTAEIGVRIDKFAMQLLYHGSGLTANVRL